MKFAEMQELLKLISEMELTEFKMKDGDFELTVRTKEYNKTKNTTVPAIPASVMPMPSATPVATPVVSLPATVEKTAPTPTTDSTPAPAQNYLEVKSPIVGTFYRSASPDKPAYIKVGDTIEVGSVVCIVEAMKLFNEIESEVAGTIVKVLVEDAQPVEYDQPLFLVEP